MHEAPADHVDLLTNLLCKLLKQTKLEKGSNLKRNGEPPVGKFLLSI